MYIVKWLIGLVVVIIISILIGVAFDNTEQSECYKWQKQSNQFGGFYLTQWQADQCAAHDIQINAPVK